MRHDAAPTVPGLAAVWIPTSARNWRICAGQLIHHVNDAVVPLTPSNSPRRTPSYTGCSYVVIVDAASGSLLTNGQHCTNS